MTPASTPDAGFQQPFWPTPATMSLVDHLAPWLAVHPLHSPPELTFDFFRISNAHGSVVNALMALQSPQSAMDFWDFILSFQCFCILVVSVGFCAFFYLFVCGGHCRPWGRDLVMRVWRATLSIQCRAQSLDAHSGSSPLPFLTTEKFCCPSRREGMHFQFVRTFDQGVFFSMTFHVPSLAILALCLLFDQTLVFPGEGPTSNRMSLVTANIGSVRTNTDWQSWPDDIICLQETRVGKNNVRSTSFQFREAGFEPVLGPLLPGIIHQKGWTQTPCGGTAVLGPKGATRPFELSDDATGLFQKLQLSKICAFAWVQVTPQRAALIVSVYAITGASQDDQLHQDNDAIFSDVFTVAAKFGSIPVFVAGDFQANPFPIPPLQTRS